jgi:hypothetical protein
MFSLAGEFVFGTSLLSAQSENSTFKGLLRDKVQTIVFGMMPKSLTQPAKHFGYLFLSTIPWDITCSEVQLGNFPGSHSLVSSSVPRL